MPSADHPLEPAVVGVHRNDVHDITKEPEDEIYLVEGLGVEGDVHAGATVQHRSRVARDPNQPNVRQVHLIHAELHDELRASGYELAPGEMGENITTVGLDLLALPTGTRLQLGDQAVVELTGLRNPCKQLDGLRRGLMGAVLSRDEAGELVREAGVMSVVVAGGAVRPGDVITVDLPGGEHLSLTPV
ncbi:MAG: MOSC domain-containing protein [Acidimicrobiales bacterium]